jgi:hypothetical protein
VTDVLARLYAQKLTARTGQQFLVENRVGGGGTIGTDFIARAKPDGYTLGVFLDSNTIAPALFAKVNSDPIKDFTPISMLAEQAIGAQLELGAYATTYIPTTTASATRVADSFSRNNVYTNGLIGASGGTWFVELRNNIAYVRDVFGSLWIGDNSSSFATGNSLSIRSQSPTSALLSTNLFD